MLLFVKAKAIDYSVAPVEKHFSYEPIPRQEIDKAFFVPTLVHNHLLRTPGALPKTKLDWRPKDFDELKKKVDEFLEKTEDPSNPNYSMADTRFPPEMAARYRRSFDHSLRYLLAEHAIIPTPGEETQKHPSLLARFRNFLGLTA